MSKSGTATVDRDRTRQGGSMNRGPGEGVVPTLGERPRGGFFHQYKPEQGKTVRTASFIGLALLIAWGAKFVNDRLAIYQGDEGWRLLITPGIAILFAVVIGALAWRLVFANRGPSDFMIATEGEMKKVSWSTRREVVGSTKVVILFTVLLAALLFVVDILFRELFKAIGVLKL